MCHHTVLSPRRARLGNRRQKLKEQIEARLHHESEADLTMLSEFFIIGQWVRLCKMIENQEIEENCSTC